MQADTKGEESDHDEDRPADESANTKDSEEKLASGENGSAATADANDVAAEGKATSQCLYRPSLFRRLPTAVTISEALTAMSI